MFCFFLSWFGDVVFLLSCLGGGEERGHSYSLKYGQSDKGQNGNAQQISVWHWMFKKLFQKHWLSLSLPSVQLSELTVSHNDCAENRTNSIQLIWVHFISARSSRIEFSPSALYVLHSLPHLFSVCLSLVILSHFQLPSALSVWVTTDFQLLSPSPFLCERTFN